MGRSRTLPSVIVTAASLLLVACGSANPAGSDGAVDTGDVSYRAEAIIGALDRLGLSKRDGDAGLCTVIRLVHPGASGDFGISLPEQWGIESAFVHRDLDECDASAFPTESSVLADSGAGEIGFAVTELYPAVIDIVDLEVQFSPGEPWVPDTVTMRATDIPLTAAR